MPLAKDPNAAVVREVASAIQGLHRRLLGYAEIFSPLHDDGIIELLQHSAVLLRLEELESDELEIVSPPIYGRYVMTVSSRLTPDHRRFAIRHGLGHVVAGHVAELAFLSGVRDWQGHEERVADLFALADLIPAAMIEDMRTSRAGWQAIKTQVRRDVIRHSLNWPTERVIDRMVLRVDLYREAGL